MKKGSNMRLTSKF